MLCTACFDAGMNMKSEKAKARESAWRKANRDKLNAYGRALRAADPEGANAKNRAWYAANPKARANRSKYHQERKIEARLKAFAHYGPDGKAACCRCGIADPDVLTLDHVNDDGASHRKMDKQAKALCFWVAKKGFPDGFRTLCLNCNYKKHLVNVRKRTAEKIESLYRTF